MTPEENAAYINAQAAAALIEAKGMEAENQHRLSCGHSIAYGEEAFNRLIETYGLGCNALIERINSIR